MSLWNQCTELELEGAGQWNYGPGGPRQIVMSRGRDLRRRRTGSLLTTLIINCKPDCTLYGSRAKTLYRITIQRFRVIHRTDQYAANCNFASINDGETQR